MHNYYVKIWYLYSECDDCLKYGRPAEQPQQAKVFKIAHLLALYSACHVKKDAYTLRGWTYILLSCALLRKSEAAALAIQHLDVPTDSVTGDILLEQGLPRFVYVTIQRSKTDQQGEGIIFCNIVVLELANFNLGFVNRSTFTPPEKHRELQTLSCVDIDDMVDSTQVRWVLTCFTNYLFKIIIMLGLQSTVWSHSRSCVSQFVHVFIGKAHAKWSLQENIQEDDAMYVQSNNHI